MIRNLSDNDIKQMEISYYKLFNKINRRSGKDRRIAINSFIDPSKERRSGKDRRKNE